MIGKFALISRDTIVNIILLSSFHKIDDGHDRMPWIGTPMEITEMLEKMKTLNQYLKQVAKKKKKMSCELTAQRSV